jgi:hypothetical protein
MMSQPARAELKPYADKLHDMQFHGECPAADGSGTFTLHGIRYLDDLRSRQDKDMTEQTTGE